MVLVKYPNPVLKKKAEIVTEFGEILKKTAYAMFRIMDENKGIGLAASQIGVLKRIIIVHGRLANENKSWKTYINPEIVSSSGEYVYNEGCLSHPGIHIDVKRPKIINIKYQDIAGKEYSETIESIDGNVLAQVIQHEIDHLWGVNLVDKMTPGQKFLNDKKLMRLEKEYRKNK